MFKILKSIALPLISLLILMLSGFFMTYTTVRLRLEGYNSDLVGCVTSAYYVGLLVGSYYSARFMARFGIIKTYILFAVLTALFTFLQGMWINPYFWSFVRLFNGFSSAILYIALQSWFLIRSTTATRAKVLSLYMIAYYGGSSLAQVCLNLSDPRSLAPCAVATVLTLLSILPLLPAWNEQFTTEQSSSLKLGKLYRFSPLGFMGCFVAGMILAGVNGLSPSYAQDMHMDISQIGLFMGLTIFGGLILQLPLGYLADRIDRRMILLLATLGTLITSCVILVQGGHNYALLLTIGFLFGGFSFTLYPLSVSHTCDAVAPEQYVAASGGLQIAYGIGAIVGPLIAMLSMKWLEAPGLYVYFTTVSAGLVLLISVSLLKKRGGVNTLKS